MLNRAIGHCAAIKDFGNARGVRNLVDKVMDAQTDRIITLSSDGREIKKEDYEVIRIENVKTAFQNLYGVQL